jgi:hypothetical protein
MQYIGGLLGYSSSTKSIYNCHSEMNITVDSPNRTCIAIGGFIGSHYGNNQNISECYSTGSIYTEAYSAQDFGGFIGVISSTLMSDCYAIGNVHIISGQASYCSSMLGRISFSFTANRCHSEGNLLCEGNNFSNCGGFSGYGIFDSVSDCYAIGSVSCPENSQNIGGFSGYIYFTLDLIRCYSLGSVSGGNYVGGFSGYISSSKSVTQCLSRGLVTCAKFICGGFSASIFANHIDCYTHSDVTNIGSNDSQKYVGGFAGKLSGSYSLERCYSIGKITVDNISEVDPIDYIGGLVGYV